MRLLAITPASAPAQPGKLVAAWLRAGAGDWGLTVLLRAPGAHPLAILADTLALRCELRARGLPALLSIASQQLRDDELAATLRSTRPALAGVQLRADPDGRELEAARRALPGWIIGRSCHGEPRRVPVEPAFDYSCLAPIFPPSTTQPGVTKRAIGLEPLRRWAQQVPRVFALGGVGPDNAANCLDAGASGLAGIGVFFAEPERAQDNVAALCRALRESHVQPSPRAGPR